MKEFNLSEERKKIIEASKPFVDNLLLKNIFLNIENQDKEFIKRLKEDISFNPETRNLTDVLNLLDKLAGEDLI